MTRTIKDRLGVCSWSLKPANAAGLIDGLRACELGVVQLALDPVREQPSAWSDVAKRLTEADVRIASGMMGCLGEDYSTLDTIRRTGGLVPDETWDPNRDRILSNLRIAVNLGMSTISTHAGFIPADRRDPTFAKLVGRIGWVADTFAAEGIMLLLETGQETAEALSAFLDAVNRSNVGVNFDPANMILYAKGDPVGSLQQVLRRVRQVHIKDAKRTEQPGTWGREVTVGQGDVDWPAFLDVLKTGGYSGDLIIEREAGSTRVADVRAAAALLRKGECLAI